MALYLMNLNKFVLKLLKCSSLVDLSSVTFEGEHAPAAGQVPLLDGRVRRPGDDVPVVDEHAGDVPLVASNGWVSKDEEIN